MSLSPSTTVDPDVGPKIEIDPDGQIASLDDIYLDGTLVLIGCGKQKRDPEDPVDLHEASVAPDEPMPGPGHTTETGPAWEARDLYTSTYSVLKREFAELVSTWSGDHDGLSGWAILSAEHHILFPWQDVKPYEKTIDDIGDDPTNPDHTVQNAHHLRRPDGEEVVTEMDRWARLVACAYARWVASYREGSFRGSGQNANTLLFLAGQRYVEPLRERGVFDYGIERMAGDPNDLRHAPGLRTRFLFEEIPAEGIGHQMAWLSDAVGQLESIHDSGPGTEHASLGGGS